MNKIMKHKFLVGMTVILVIGLLLASCAPKPATTSAFEWPEPLVWGSHDMNTGGYIIAAAVADAFNRAEGMTVRVVPTGTDIAKMTLLANKRVHISWIMAGTFFAQEGLEDFAAINWGPQPMRYIIGSLSNVCLASAADANINSAADLKGKRVAYIVGYPAANIIPTAWLRFANLTWDDVEKVEFPSASASKQGMIDGTADAIYGLTTTAANYQLESSPRGLKFVSLPHDDNEGWERIAEIMPYMVRRVATEGAGGLSETNTIECGGYPNPGLNALADTDADLVYNQTRLMVELFPQYSQVKAPGIGGLALDQQSGFKWTVPYHEGAIRYYKEIGVWTDEAQQQTDRLIERQKVLQQAWDKALDEAIKQEVKSTNFPKLWYEIRGQALVAAGFDPYYKGTGFDPWD
ncbi:TAXI family TRAP transporter solute-binding subunit [Chloroflexota bacterium]